MVDKKQEKAILQDLDSPVRQPLGAFGQALPQEAVVSQVP